MMTTGVEQHTSSKLRVLLVAVCVWLLMAFNCVFMGQLAYADEVVGNPALEPLSLDDEANFEAGTVLVRINDDLSLGDFDVLLAGVPGISLDAEPLEFADGWYQVFLENGADVEDVVNTLNALGGAVEAQPNYAFEMMSDLSAGDFFRLVAHASKVDVLAEAHAAEESGAYLLAQAVNVNDPLAANQWSLEALHLPETWELVKGNKSVTIALMDVGCDITHEDLTANVVTSYNSAEDKPNYEMDDLTGHGTHVAGIVSAVSDNALGVSGVSYNAQILPIKVVAADGRAYTNSLIRAYNYVIKHKDEFNIRVINLSMGTPGDPEKYRDWGLLDKIDEAFNAGILTVCSAGNATTTAVPPYQNYPGDYRSVVSTISLQAGDDGSYSKSGSSNYNAAGETTKNISAPGVEILSTYLYNSTLYGGRYGTLSGTSMAAPHVAAVLALEFAANPDLTAAQARDVLYSTTTDLLDTGFDEQTGWGMVNALGAVEGAQTYIDGLDLVIVGEKVDFSVVGEVGSVRFSSSDPNVLSIDEFGHAQALSEGTINVLAECSAEGAPDEGASKWTLVKQVSVCSPAITGPTSVKFGRTASYGITPVMQRDWVWAVSNSKVASIDATTGRLKALSVGKVVVTAQLMSDRHVSVSMEVTITEETVAMYRLYNPNSGEHFYTASSYERDVLKKAGWRYEGIGWYAPVSSKTPVYRLYNPNAGDHHYTTSAAEKKMLVGVGWRDEGIGWYSAEGVGRAPLWRQYNPNAKTGTHNYTLSAGERDYLVKVGWRDEGIGWYGYAKAVA
ncbi:MAG: S8 family serine peptidase [Atopobiaceae bacterium]|nr:S8 family serine peptidase [Atopobiaceae bacterium]